MQLTPETIVQANSILESRGESKSRLAEKLGLARSTVTAFFLGKSVSIESFETLKNYLELEDITYTSIGSTEEFNATSTSNTSSITTITPSLEEITLLQNSDSPHLKHLFICLMFDYLIGKEMLVKRLWILDLLQVKRLPVNWCGYCFRKSIGGYKIMRYTVLKY